MTGHATLTTGAATAHYFQGVRHCDGIQQVIARFVHGVTKTAATHQRFNVLSCHLTAGRDDCLVDVLQDFNLFALIFGDTHRFDNAGQVSRGVFEVMDALREQLFQVGQDSRDLRRHSVEFMTVGSLEAGLHTHVDAERFRVREVPLTGCERLRTLNGVVYARLTTHVCGANTLHHVVVVFGGLQRPHEGAFNLHPGPQCSQGFDHPHLLFDSRVLRLDFSATGFLSVQDRLVAFAKRGLVALNVGEVTLAQGDAFPQLGVALLCGSDRGLHTLAFGADQIHALLEGFHLVQFELKLIAQVAHIVAVDGCYTAIRQTTAVDLHRRCHCSRFGFFKLALICLLCTKHGRQRCFLVGDQLLVFGELRSQLTCRSVFRRQGRKLNLFGGFLLRRAEVTRRPLLSGQAVCRCLAGSANVAVGA